MGQKSNPIGLRLGINRSWSSVWFAKKGPQFAKRLYEDARIRKFLEDHYQKAGISSVHIERVDEAIRVRIRCARVGALIGKKGVDIEKLKEALLKFLGPITLSLDVEEVRKPDLDPQLVASNIARQFEKRVSTRRAMKKAVTSVMKSGALGVKVICSGRLAGAEIARREWYLEGSVPLHTLRAHVGYGADVAKTSYGTCGVKVMICTAERVE